MLGGERSMLATLPAVVAAGFDVVVAGPPCGALATALRERGITHVAWETHGETQRRQPLAEIRSSLNAVTQQLRPDLVHANSLSTARIAGPISEANGIRSIGHLRDIINLTKNVVADLNRHNLLIAVSDATRKSHMAQGLDRAKCVVVYNGVDLNEFRPRPSTGYLHRELRLPSDVQLITVIGQLGLRKGTDVALAGAQQLAARLPKIHWLIVGERSSAKHESRLYESRLRQMSSQAPLAGRVHFLGVRNDIASLLPECTLLAHTAHQEPLGRVLLEAAACGVAIVATKVGGTPEIFPRQLECASLVEPDDPAATAHAIASLLADESRRRSMAAAARCRAESAFDIRIASQHLIKQYNQALG
jgi:glycosyltransferase involved in cell wall biosynthesis